MSCSIRTLLSNSARSAAAQDAAGTQLRGILLIKLPKFRTFSTRVPLLPERGFGVSKLIRGHLQQNIGT